MGFNWVVDVGGGPVSVARGMAVTSGIAVLCEGDGGAVVARGAINERSAGSGEAGLCLGTAEGLTGSGEGRL